jgi:hypothetical protein
MGDQKNNLNKRTAEEWSYGFSLFYSKVGFTALAYCNVIIANLRTSPTPDDLSLEKATEATGGWLITLYSQSISAFDVVGALP